MMTEHDSPGKISASPQHPDQEIHPPKFLAPPAEAEGMRLDTWLSRQPGAPSRNRVQQLVKDGHVKVNGEKAKRVHQIQKEDRVEVAWPDAEDDWPWPQNIPLDIVYTDDEIAVVNKPRDMVVHPCGGHPDGTLVNALLHRFPDLPGINGVKRPGIVHRLDKDTTGLMVVAKTARAMKSLARQLEERAVKRTYLALIVGDPDWEETTVEAAVGANPSNRLLRKIDGNFARHAKSHFSVLDRSGPFTLIRCRLETGRTHQIRIHCQHIGHPIVCDEAYGGHIHLALERLKPEQSRLRGLLKKFARPFLHSYTLKFAHPTKHELVSFEALPPDDAQELLSAIFPGWRDSLPGK